MARFCAHCGRQHPDEVKFCPGCGEPTPVISPTVVEANARRSRRWLKMTAISAGVVTVLALAALPRVLALLGNQVVAAIPADAEVYIEFDFLDAIRGPLQDRFEYYVDAINDADIDLEMLDRGRRLELNIDVERDIVPWMGRYMALAFFDTVPTYEVGAGLGGDEWALQLIPWGDEEGDLLLIAQARDRDRADRFLSNLADEFDDNAFEIDKNDISGVEFYEASGSLGWNDGYNSPYSGTFVFGRVDDLVILSGSRSTVRAVLAVTEGRQDSIEDTDDFNTAMATLPSGGFARGYVSSALLDDLYARTESKLVEGAGVQDIDAPEVADTTLSFSIDLDDDYLTTRVVFGFDEETLGTDVRDLLELATSEHRAIHGLLPSEHELTVTWPRYVETLELACMRVDDDDFCDEVREVRRDSYDVLALPFNGSGSVIEAFLFADRDSAEDFTDEWGGEDPVEVEDGFGHVYWVATEEPEIYRSLLTLQHKDAYAVAVDQLAGDGVVFAFLDALVASDSYHDRDDSNARLIADLLDPLTWAVAAGDWDGAHLRFTGVAKWTSPSG